MVTYRGVSLEARWMSNDSPRSFNEKLGELKGIRLGTVVSTAKYDD